MPLQAAPPRTNRFGSPLVLSRVHWVRPELVVEVKYLTWTDDNLLRQVIYEGLSEDKDPTEVRRPVPNSSGRVRAPNRRTQPKVCLTYPAFAIGPRSKRGCSSN